MYYYFLHFCLFFDPWIWPSLAIKNQYQPRHRNKNNDSYLDNSAAMLEEITACAENNNVPSSL